VTLPIETSEPQPKSAVNESRTRREDRTAHP
jgi:hypothetical protein